MTIFRGPGGTGSATSDSDTTEFQEFLVQSQAARDAALAAQVAAELAETNAETAETNAETAETNAETAATNAASSASAAASSASSASTSATNAASSASAASTSATNASASASAAAASASAALTSENNAETAETNAAASASAAASSASTATTQASNAAASASAALASETAAASSASSASSSASAASISASNAATSASNAASSATSAANSASAAAASATEAANTLASTVKLTGDQTIAGVKTFTSTISGSIDGNAANVTGTVAVMNGGTGSTTASEARTNLGAQETLISGTNIKTLNSQSLLGAGNLSIEVTDGDKGDIVVSLSGTAWTVDAGAITTTKIADANVTGAKLENSGVTAGTYGSSSTIPVVVVDSKGRVTNISTQSVSAPDPTTAQVLSATAGASVGAVGSYAFLSLISTAGALVSAGSTRAGSSLLYSNGTGDPATGTPSGTWRIMGASYDLGVSANRSTSLWLRIS